MIPQISKATVPWSHDYDAPTIGFEHPAIARMLRVPFKVINGCAIRTPMLVRYRLLNTSFGSLNVHHFLRGDEDRDLHDHPFAFVSLILSGGYWEQTKPTVETAFGVNRRDLDWKRPGSLLFRRATHAHRVELDHSLPDYGFVRDAWTLIAMSKKKREWGFFTRAGWIPFRQYNSVAGCAESDS